MNGTIAAILLFAGAADAEWNADEKAVIAQMTALSQSTREGGGGADAYAAMLAPGFTRWTVGGNVINGRDAWIEGVADWLNEGGLVLGGTNDVLEITIEDDFAATRRIVVERMKNPDGSVATYRTGVAEIWRRDENGAWLLWRASVKPEPVVD
ncbi:MAG TPA: DUF4440 domain-containing protein [Parvularculaceae bacterium]|nr:DUF4440 domain-containing protein [Parvularculaceae bacterium]